MEKKEKSAIKLCGKLKVNHVQPPVQEFYLWTCLCFPPHFCLSLSFFLLEYSTIITENVEFICTQTKEEEGLYLVSKVHLLTVLNFTLTILHHQVDVVADWCKLPTPGFHCTIGWFLQWLIAGNTKGSADYFYVVNDQVFPSVDCFFPDGIRLVQKL